MYIFGVKNSKSKCGVRKIIIIKFKADIPIFIKFLLPKCSLVALSNLIIIPI